MDIYKLTEYFEKTIHNAFPDRGVQTTKFLLRG
jgi:hypothetical protein